MGLKARGGGGGSYPGGLISGIKNVSERLDKAWVPYNRPGRPGRLGLSNYVQATGTMLWKHHRDTADDRKDRKDRGRSRSLG